jgi:hypothetical protein
MSPELSFVNKTPGRPGVPLRLENTHASLQIACSFILILFPEEKRDPTASLSLHERGIEGEGSASPNYKLYAASN